MTPPVEKQHLRALQARVQSAICNPEFMRELLAGLLTDPTRTDLPLIAALQRTLLGHMHADQQMLLGAAADLGSLLDQHAAEAIKRDHCRRMPMPMPMLNIDGERIPMLLQEQAN